MNELLEVIKNKDLLIQKLQQEKNTTMSKKDDDILICCLQKQNDDLYEIIKTIEQDSNPAHLYKMRLEYENNVKKGKYNE